MSALEAFSSIMRAADEIILESEFCGDAVKNRFLEIKAAALAKVPRHQLFELGNEDAALSAFELMEKATEWRRRAQTFEGLLRQAQEECQSLTTLVADAQAESAQRREACEAALRSVADWKQAAAAADAQRRALEERALADVHQARRELAEGTRSADARASDAELTAWRARERLSVAQKAIRDLEAQVAEAVAWRAAERDRLAATAREDAEVSPASVEGRGTGRRVLRA